MFITAVSVLFLIRLRWPKDKSINVSTLIFIIYLRYAQIFTEQILRQLQNIEKNGKIHKKNIFL